MKISESDVKIKEYVPSLSYIYHRKKGLQLLLFKYQNCLHTKADFDYYNILDRYYKLSDKVFIDDT